MPESDSGTAISGFADNKQKNKKLIPTDRPQIFLTCDSKHTYIFFWPKFKKKIFDKNIDIP